MHPTDMQWLLTALFAAAEPSMILAVFVGYVAIALMAYQRFNRLAVPFEGCEFLPATRAWTTKLRYHVSALAYLSVNLFLFRVTLLYPDLLTAMSNGSAPLAALVSAVFGDSLPGDHWIVPLLIAALVYLLFRPDTGAALGLELPLRRWLQRASSIPRSVRSLLGVVQSAGIRPPTGAELEGPEVEDERLRLLREPQESVEALWARAHYLDGIIESWANPTSEFSEFWRRNQPGLIALRRTTETVQMAVERYRTAQRVGYTEDVATTDRGGVAEQLQDWLEQERTSTSAELHHLLDRLHITLACAQLATFGSLRESHAQLGRYGLQVGARAQRHDTDTGISGLMEDTGLLLIALIIVVYPATVVAAAVLGQQPTAEVYQVWFIWPTTISVMVAAALWPAFQARCWVERSAAGGERWRLPVMAAGIAYAAAFVALAVIVVLDCKWDAACQASWFALGIRAGSCALISAAVAGGLGLTLQNRSDSFGTRLGEAALVALLTVVAGLLAYTLRTGDANLGGSLPLIEVRGLLVFACAFVGLVLGFLIPHGFRRHALEVLGELDPIPSASPERVERAFNPG